LRGGAGVRRAAAELAAAAAAHLRHGRHNGAGVPRHARAALLPAVVADRFLLRLQRAGHDPFAPALAMPDTLQSWRLAAAALRGRF